MVWKRVAVGGAAGAVATVFMSALMLGAQKAGLMGRMPPEKITARALDRAGWRHRGRTTQDVLAAGAHIGFGAAGGAVFALLERLPGPGILAVPAGIAFGTGVWLVSYEGWVPALGIMPPAHDDRPGRPEAMLAGHLVYGAVLGGIVALTRGRMEAGSSKAAA